MKNKDHFVTEQTPASPPPNRLGTADLDETHLRSILATVPDAMVIIDAAGTILSFSSAAERMFGYAEAEILGENVSALMPSPDRERHDGYINRYLGTGERRIIGIGRITTARRRDGSTFPIELSIGEAETPRGKTFTGFIRDLTETQQTERRLQDLQTELAHMSRVSAMGTLASALAHELNQPLTAVVNYIEGARDLLADPRPEICDMVKEALDEAAAQAIRAGHIVRRLRDFIARGDTEKRIESLRKLVTEANALALVGAGERGIEVLVDLDRKADHVLVDRIQVQQVLLNLIRNAIEAMNDSLDKQLRIIARHEDDGSVHVRVEDSGPGLDPRVAAHLFEPFFSTKDTGMGLGLSICRTIIEGQGGRIWADRSPIGGTAFHFTLIAANTDREDED